MLYTWGGSQWGQFPWGGGSTDENLGVSTFPTVSGELKLYFTKFHGFKTNNWYALEDVEGNNLLLSASGVSVKSEKVINPSEIQASIPTFKIWNKYEPGATPKRWLDNLTNQTLVNIQRTGVETGWNKNLFDKIFQLRLVLYWNQNTKEIPLVTVFPDELITFGNNDEAELQCKSTIAMLKDHPAEKARPDPSNWYQYKSIAEILRFLLQKDNGYYDNEYKGTATSSTSLTLVDGGASFPVDGFIDGRIKITDGTGKGQIRTVTDNDGTSVTVDTQWVTNPDTTSDYVIECSNGYAGIFDKTDVDYFFNTDASIVTSGMETYGDRILTSTESVKNLSGNPQFGNAAGNFNNNVTETNELYIGAGNHIYFINPYDSDDWVEIDEANFPAALGATYYVFRLWIVRDSGKDYLYGVAITNSQAGGDDDNYHSPAVSMKFFQYNITDGYETPGDPASSNGRPSTSATVIINGTTISDVYVGDILESYSYASPLFMVNHFGSYDSNTKTNCFIFNDQVISIEINAVDATNKIEGDFFENDGWRWLIIGSSSVLPYDWYKIISGIYASYASGTSLIDIDMSGNNRYFGTGRIQAKMLTTGLVNGRLTFNSGSNGFIYYDFVNDRIYYYKYSPTTYKSTIYYREITDHSTFAISAEATYQSNIDGQITSGCVDSSGNVFYATYRCATSSPNISSQIIIYKNALTKLYDRTDTAPSTTSSPAYIDLYRVPIITEMIDDTNSTDQILICGRGAKVVYSGSNPQSTANPICHIASIPKTTVTMTTNFNDEYIDTSGYMWCSLIQSGSADDHKIYIIKQNEGKLYEWNRDGTAPAKTGDNTCGDETYNISQIAIDNRNGGERYGTFIYGISHNHYNPLMTGITPSENESNIWKYDKTLSNSFRLFDFQDVDVWEVITKLAQATNRVSGFYPDGTFFFKDRPLITDSSVVTLTDEDYNENIQKEFGRKTIKNEIVATPYVAQRGGTSIDTYDTNVFTGRVEMVQKDDSFGRVKVTINGVNSVKYQSDELINDFGVDYILGVAAFTDEWISLSTDSRCNVDVRFGGLPTKGDVFVIHKAGLEAKKEVNLERRVADYDSQQEYGNFIDDSLNENKFIVTPDHAQIAVDNALAQWKDPHAIYKINQALLRFYDDTGAVLLPLARIDLINNEFGLTSAKECYLIEYGYNIKKGSMYWVVRELPEVT